MTELNQTEELIEVGGENKIPRGGKKGRIVLYIIGIILLTVILYLTLTRGPHKKAQMEYLPDTPSLKYTTEFASSSPDGKWLSYTSAEKTILYNLEIKKSFTFTFPFEKKPVAGSRAEITWSSDSRYNFYDDSPEYKRYGTDGSIPVTTFIIDTKNEHNPRLITGQKEMDAIVKDKKIDWKLGFGNGNISNNTIQSSFLDPQLAKLRKLYPDIFYEDPTERIFKSNWYTVVFNFNLEKALLTKGYNNDEKKAEHNIYAFDLDTMKMQTIQAWPKAAIHYASFSPDDKYIIYGATTPWCFHNRWFLYDLSKNKSTELTGLKIDFPDSAPPFIWSKDGKSIYALDTREFGRAHTKLARHYLVKVEILP